MTTGEVIDFVCTHDGTTVLHHFADMPMAERRKHAKALAKLFSDTEWDLLGRPFKTKVKDKDAVRIAVLATTTLSELKRLNMWMLTHHPSIVEVLRVLKPDWIEGWVAHLMDGAPHMVARLQGIWQAGLCRRPTSDAYILGYFAPNFPGMAFDDVFFDHDVWRFFEVEGGDGFNLTSNDSGRDPTDPDTWWYKLRDYEKAGKLDRDRLLDASLDAIDCGFSAYATGWFLKFHMALEPTPTELKQRQERYIGMLGFTGPQTVVFAVKILEVLRKEKALDPAAVIAALQPALQARTKAAVTAAMRLLANLAKDAPSCRPAAAIVTTYALITEDAGLQNKALDLIEKLDGAVVPEVRSSLAEYLPFAAASVQPRMAAMAEAEVDNSDATQEEALVWAAPVPSPAHPVKDAEEALALFLHVLESPRDPFEVERAIDGIAKFGAALRVDPERLSPLKKRAQQVTGTAQEHEIRVATAITGRMLSEGQSCRAIIRELERDIYFHPFSSSQRHKSMSRLFLDRNTEVVEMVGSGAALPLLSLPSDTTGCVACADLVARLAAYRDAGVAPPPIDLQLALLRLAKEGRADALAAIPDETETDRAVRYACGADVAPGKNAALWAAAWATRQPTAKDKRIATLCKRLPDCGIPADLALKVWTEDSKHGDYAWTRISVDAGTTKRTKTDAAIPAMFYSKPEFEYAGASILGYVHEDVAWASLVRPGYPEPFFRQAILSMNPDQKLSDHYCLAFIEPFFRPDIGLGPLARSTLAYYLTSVDKPLAALTVEAVTEFAMTGKLTAADFADAIRPFLAGGNFPTGRWTKALSAMAKAGADQFARDVITHLLTFPADETPRDIGGMLELLYELHLVTKTVPEDAKTLTCLRDIPSGGKAATFKKKLLKLTA